MKHFICFILFGLCVGFYWKNGAAVTKQVNKPSLVFVEQWQLIDQKHQLGLYNGGLWIYA
jgi:hypothetical protein